MEIQPGKVEHLYVHVPFCAAKCNYCAFYSEAGSAGRMADYVEALIAELEGYCRAGSPLATDPAPGLCPKLEGHALSWPHFTNGRDGARPSKSQIRTLPGRAVA